jgi:hypothetical protein
MIECAVRVLSSCFANDKQPSAPPCLFLTLATRYTARDLWAHEELGTLTSATGLTANVTSHGVAMIQLTKV